MAPRDTSDTAMMPPPPPPQQQQLEGLLRFSQQQQGAVGPLNPPDIDSLLSKLVEVFQKQQESQQQTLEVVRGQSEMLRQQQARLASSMQASEQRTRQVLLSIPTVQPEKGEPHRKCGVFKRDPAQCKGPKENKNSPMGMMLSILSINEAREGNLEEEEEDVPVFLESAKSRLGYRLNPKSALSDRVVCMGCKAVTCELAIPVNTTNPKVCCVICKAMLGVGMVSWNPTNVLCDVCQHSASETKLERPLQQLVAGLNRVVETPQYERSLKMFLGKVPECKVKDEFWVDALIHVRNVAGEVVAAVVLEIDANQHAGSQYDNEFDRNAEIIICMRERHKDSKILFARFNPNADVSVKVDKSDETELLRIPILQRLLVLQSWLLAVSLDTGLFPEAAMLYLFYGHDNKRLWPTAVDGQDMGVKRCVTHRAVRPGWKGKGAVWWRYVPDPAVSLQLDKHYSKKGNPFKADKCERLCEGGPFRIQS